jgi:hypothetical protein
MKWRARVLSVLALLLLVLGGLSQLRSSPSIGGTATARTAAPVTSKSPLPTTRYSLVHGCYRLRSGGHEIAAADGPFRMQAAALGEYLIYGVHEDFLGPAMTPVSSPDQSTL